MSMMDRINQADLWVLDRLFQPLSDRLPERWPAVDIGMSLQLGAVLFYGVAIVLLIMMGGQSFSDQMLSVVQWCVGAAFYFGLHRMRALVKPGQANPLRFMLMGARPLSVPFLIFSFWQLETAPIAFRMALWFMTLSELAFVTGLYLISCQPRAPGWRKDTKRQEARSHLSVVKT
ncbi:hypothetical protein [Brytella acorum]|uniref:Uncharacterized protein n=1 Tax=Brytella acorum TaxID=2959299 RepID=A0AA35Y4Q6_9PROT|nr:hypothetical protein [Brytella acorum]MDF3623519.1 hypothetical protein [Brytella acorum]CAI9121348.1 hypothetical protein LMG32879_002195 [Brytella acorum]